MTSCFACGADLSALGAIGRRDVCPGCGADARCCRNCHFYEPRAYNECREPQAERVVDKTRANFCDFFTQGAAAGQATGGEPGASARERLAALFRKKPPGP